jgi:diaminopimelate decarboxylase
MNNHLPASGHFGMVIHRNYVMHKVDDESDDLEDVDLVGPLCTSIDRLARGVKLPPIEVGSYIAIHNSGAYGPTASPIHFISHKEPCEVIVNGDSIQNVTWLRC